MLLTRKTTPEDLAVCTEMALEAYARERAANPVLTEARAEDLSGPLKWVLEQGLGWLALEDGTAVGFLAFCPPHDGMFGDCRGVFSPVHASAFGGSDPERTLTALLGAATEELYAQGVTSVGISRYAHEEATLRGLCLSGYGIRCCDLMRRVETTEKAPLPYEVRAMHAGEEEAVARLANALEEHMERTPVLLPQNRVTAQMVADWDAVYVACDGGGAFAFLIVEEGGETFVDDLPGTRHVGKAYCEPGHRGGGAMPALLAAAQRDLAAQGIARLGVDCETLNPPAYRFWRRHFSAFTYSAVRRLDERLRQ